MKTLSMNDSISPLITRITAGTDKRTALAIVKAFNSFDNFLSITYFKTSIRE